MLDEIIRVLKYITDSHCPPRAHELLQELRDISSMAMEHFDEHIVPTLKSYMPSVTAYGLSNSFSVDHSSDYGSPSG